MSDGSISQDEIDALLSGVGEIGRAGAMPSGSEYTKIEEFAKGNMPAFSSNLASMTGGNVSLTDLNIEHTERENFLQKLPDMVVSVHVNFSGTLEGDHLFVSSPDFAKKIIGLINHEDDVEIDDMGLSVLAETMAQFMGAEVTSLESLGFKGVVSAPPSPDHLPKAALRLPAGNFLMLSYKVEVDGSFYDMWEVISDNAASTITEKLSGQSSSSGETQAMGIDMGMGQPAAMPQQGGMQMNNMQFGTSQMGMPQMNMGQQPSGGAAQFGMPQNGFIMGGMSNPNVQQVQFPPLQNYVSEEEAGNISLIMDVYMEMTVELGRTKKMIKEILGMGEGHIIELDKLAGEPVDILVNHKPIAKGEVVVIEENFGVRVTEILSPAERITDI